MNDVLILGPGELHVREKFGPATVNRGAALFECEWDGGRFESGLFSGGMFRSGEFLGGTFLPSQPLSGRVFHSQRAWNAGLHGIL
jgi:hypothetical protein